MKFKRIAFLLCVLSIAAVLAMWLIQPSGIRTYGSCSICLRPIHSEMAALYHTNEGGQKTACCVACVFAHGRQTGRVTTLDQVTDYLSGERFGPERATFVVGSDKHVCQHQDMVMDQNKTTMPVHFDRCEPPVMAFRNAADATAFAREHGGTVEKLDELIRGFEGARP